MADICWSQVQSVCFVCSNVGESAVENTATGGITFLHTHINGYLYYQLDTVTYLLLQQDMCQSNPVLLNASVSGPLIKRRAVFIYTVLSTLHFTGSGSTTRSNPSNYMRHNAFFSVTDAHLIEGVSNYEIWWCTYPVAVAVTAICIPGEKIKVTVFLDTWF